MKNCKDCIHYGKDFKAGTNAGFCKFNPPVAFLIPMPGGLTLEMQVRSFFPPVNQNEWCSKFEERIEVTVSDMNYKRKTD